MKTFPLIVLAFLSSLAAMAGDEYEPVTQIPAASAGTVNKQCNAPQTAACALRNKNRNDYDAIWCCAPNFKVTDEKCLEMAYEYFEVMFPRNAATKAAAQTKLATLGQTACTPDLAAIVGSAAMTVAQAAATAAATTPVQPITNPIVMTPSNNPPPRRGKLAGASCIDGSECQSGSCKLGLSFGVCQ